MTKHMPGPWRLSIHEVEDNPAQGLRVYGVGESDWIADCGLPGDAPREANARLIAAAPALLAALRLLVKDSTESKHWNAAFAAIRLATKGPPNDRT